jgi:acetyltransferase
MSTYRLEKLFAPRSIAVIGGSARRTSTGRAVLDNVLAGGFAGAVHLVNPRYDEIAGVRAVKSCDALPDAPDVVAIAVPPAAVPDAVADASRKAAPSASSSRRGLVMVPVRSPRCASAMPAPPACA